MYSLTREQKLANLKETFQQKLGKYQRLEKELRDLQSKIQKLEAKGQEPAQKQNIAPATAPTTKTVTRPATTGVSPMKLG